MQDTKRWTAVLSRTETSEDRFFYAVKTTNIYCRPGCPSRRPDLKNVVFFDASSDAERAGFRPCLRCRPNDTKPTVVESLCRYIENHADGAVTLDALSKFARLSPSHLQRMFKDAMGVSPREYASAHRAKRLKSELSHGAPVTDALYEAGYGSSSRLYERSDEELGMTPSSYRKGGKGEQIDFTIAGSPLGRMLVATTARGVCAITFGESDAELEETLSKEFPGATCNYNPELLSAAVTAVVAHLKGSNGQIDLPLDIRATAFQRVVWKALQSIPYGTKVSYEDVAKAIGKPAAVRAVASACAKNRIAVAIPCHRVVHKGGGISGYRWGTDRKKLLLEQERTEATEPRTQ